jgi:hypothetical protein
MAQQLPANGNGNGNGNAGRHPGNGEVWDPEYTAGYHSPWVATMVGDACAPPDVRVLSGYLGESSREGDWHRLYFTLELNHFVEIEGPDILFVEDSGNEKLSGVTVWIRKDAKIWHMYIASEQIVAQHLRHGDLARRFLPHFNIAQRPDGDGTSGEIPYSPPSIARMC